MVTSGEREGSRGNIGVGEIIILSEVSHTEKDKYHYDIAHMQNLKKKKEANELIYKTETDSQT